MVRIPLLLLLMSLLSFAMLFALAVLWLKTYRETKSQFSLGLLLFAGILAFQEVVRLMFFFRRFLGQDAAALGNLEFIGAIGQVIALSILLYHVAR